MSRKKILIIGTAVFGVAVLLALMFGMFAARSVQPMAATGAMPTTSGWISILTTALASGGFSITALLSVVLTPIAAYFGVPGSTAQKLVLSAEDIAQITEAMKLLAATKDKQARAKIREGIKLELESVIDRWFPEEPTAT